MDSNIRPITPNHHADEVLRIRLRTRERKVEALKSLYESQKLKLERSNKILREAKQELESEEKSYRAKESKIQLIKQYINGRRISVEKRRKMINNYTEELKQIVTQRVYQLTQEIFPIDEINLLEQNSSFVNMETYPLLTFSDGSHHPIEQQTALSIVEPWLPTNGDYSAYSLWLNDNHEQVPASMNENSERNPANRIGAGLSYTTQLLLNLASYLDVILPARMELDMFCSDSLDDSQFSYNVAKLNTNVIHLCVSQGINISLLHPQQTLKNLMLLFNMNACDLGRKPMMDLENERAATKIEDQLRKDLSLMREDFYDFTKLTDEEDTSDSEWEISDTINPTDLQLAEQSMQQNSYISRLKLLTSFWRLS